MSDNSNPLLQQLAHRVDAFLTATNLTQRKLARLLKTDETHLSAFLAGRSGLSSEKSLRLLQLMNASKEQIERKLNKPVPIHIEHLQVKGEPVTRFSNDGWVPGQSGIDPVDSSDITGVWKAGGEPSDDGLIDVLRQVDNYHRQAREAIAAYLATVQRAKPNPSGVTEGPRRISDNADSRKPGPRSDKFSLQKELARIQRQREENEVELLLRKQIESEKAKNTETVMELLAIEPESEKLARAERLRKLASGKR